jgi:hypothetical protein
MRDGKVAEVEQAADLPIGNGGAATASEPATGAATPAH